MKRLAFVSCFVVLLVPQVTQACVGDPFSVHFGDTLDLQMRVKGSETCRFGFKLGHASALHGIAIEQPPQHGTLAQADATHWIYQASRGYTGPDVLKVRPREKPWATGTSGAGTSTILT